MYKQNFLKIFLALCFASDPARFALAQAQSTSASSQHPQPPAPINFSIQPNFQLAPFIAPDPQPQPADLLERSPLSQPDTPDITPDRPRSQRPKKITIPASAAVVVTFCSEFEFDEKQESSFPTTTFLARPIIDSEGNIAVPVNAPVNTQVKRDKKLVKLEADAIVVGGRVIPIQTTALSVPMLPNVRQENLRNLRVSRVNQGFILGLADSIQDWLGNQDVFLTDGTSDLLGLGMASPTPGLR